MPPCGHFVLIKSFVYATRPQAVGFGAALTCTRTLFNCLAPLVSSVDEFAFSHLQTSFAVYRLADTFRFATSIIAHCEDWPVADLRRMLAEEIDVVRSLVFCDPKDEHLDIALNLPYLNCIEVVSSHWSWISCAPLVCLFQQTNSRALRRSIVVTIRCKRINFSDTELFAPLMLEALLGAETADEFHDMLMLTREMNEDDFPRPHEVDQFMALLSDYKNNFAVSTKHPAPLGVYVVNVASECHSWYHLPFDFEPFFKYIWDKYYETGLIDELVEDRERVRGEEPFEAPSELTIAGDVVRMLFRGMILDATEASRDDFCISSYFGSVVPLYLNDLFQDGRFCNVAFGSNYALYEYDDRMVNLCCASHKFSAEMSKKLGHLDLCQNIEIWAEERAAHTTRLIHRQGVDRETAEKIVEAECGAWNEIYKARLIAATLMFGSTDLQNPPRRAVEATQRFLRELFDEDNGEKHHRLLPAFTAVLKAILLMPPDEERDDDGQVVRTDSVLEQARVKDIFIFLTHAARRERMRIRPESVAATHDNNNNDRRRSREQSEEENNENSNCSYRRYLPRLLEDNHLRQLMEQQAARGTAVVKDLLDELVSEEVIEI